MDPNTKKALIAFGIFIPVVAGLIILLNVLFHRPNHHNEAKWGVVHVQLADGPQGFSEHHRNQAELALRELNRLGPTFVLGGEGPNAVRVVNVDLTAGGRPGQCPVLGVGRYVRGPSGDHIEIDPACAHGDPEFRTTLMHEIGHALGMLHVCRSNERGDDCTALGKGDAVMNRSLLADGLDEGPGADHAYVGPSPTFEIQGLDVEEFERVNRPGQRLIHPVTDTARPLAPSSSSLIPTPSNGGISDDADDTLSCNATNRI